MQYLLAEDLHAALTALPPNLKQAMEETGQRVFVAGGFLRAIVAREPINDIDVFSEATVDANLFMLKCVQTEKIHTTPNAFSLDTKPPIQIIRNWNFATARACIESFDFSICQAAIWYHLGQWNSACSDNFYPDLAARRLRYNDSNRKGESTPVNSAVRLLKFYERGYVTTGDSLARVIRHVGKVGGDEFLEGQKVAITRSTKAY